MSELVTDGQYSFQRGMMGARRPGTLPEDACELLVNAWPALDGTGVRRREGTFRPYSESGALNSGAQCWGGTEYVKADGTRYAAMFFGDKFYTASSASATLSSATQRATGLPTNWWSIVQMRVGAFNYLIAANGGSVYYWDGTTWGTLSNWGSGIKYLAVQGQRLWGTGHSGETVLASKVGDPSIIATTAGGMSLQVATHDGDSTMSGLYALGDVLLAFKRLSVNIIQGYGYRTISVEAGAAGLSRSVGCIAPRSICGVGDMGVAWLSERGIEFLALGGSPELVSGPIRDFMDKVRWRRLDPDNDPGLPCSMWWPERHEYWLALPVGSSQTRNNYVVQWRPPTPDFPSALWLQRFKALADYTFAEDTASPSYSQQNHEWAALWMQEIGETGGSLPVYGGFDGHPRQYSSSYTNDNMTVLAGGGDPVEARVIPRPFVFKTPGRRKRAREIRVYSPSAATIYPQAQIDGSTWGAGQPEHTLTFASASSRPDTPNRKRARVRGKGRVLSVHLRTQTSGAVIAAVELDAEILHGPA